MRQREDRSRPGARISIMQDRPEHVESGSLSDPGSDRYAPAGFGHDRRDQRQTENGPALTLRGEMELPDAAPYPFRTARPGVGDRVPT